ncbi:MAG: YhdP family protein [Burkholderiaceae bacterium]
MSSSPPVIGTVRKLTRRLLMLLAAVAGIVLLAWLTLHWAILPHIDQWRPRIQAEASRALGVPLRIGELSVRSSGWVPGIELRDVVLLDAQQRPALTLPRVVAALSPSSLLAFELRFEQLFIDGAELEARRDAQGRIHVAGIDFGAATPDDGSARDWFFKQHEWVIRGATLRWTDELRQAPPLALRDVELVLRNGLRRHQFSLEASPDAGWGERFQVVGRFTQPLLARAGDWRRWSGEAFASLPRADVSQLRRHVDLPFELTEGDGALRGWFEVKAGQLRGATVDVALRSVALRLARNVESLGFEQVEGRVVAKLGDAGTSIGVRHFGFVTREGMRWPAGDMDLHWQQRGHEPSSGGGLTAQRIDIGLVAGIASQVPLGNALRRLLAELRPQGVVSDLALRWDGPLDAPVHYQVRAGLTGLALAARTSDDPGGIGRPGLRNASLQLEATERGGQARLGVADGAIDLPGVFAESVVPLETLSANLSWKVEAAPRLQDPPQISVQVKDARFANRDAQGDFKAAWRTGSGAGVARGGRFPGRLDLEGRLRQGVANRVARYLPLRLAAGARQYVERAVRAGSVSTLDFRVKGDLWEFPFQTARVAKDGANDGEFRITAHFEGLEFDYVPSVPASRDHAAFASPWPALTEGRGEFVIDRTSLAIQNASARLGGVAFTRIDGAIADLAQRSVLTLDGGGSGSLGEMLRFVNATPVRGWTGNALAQAGSTGNAELKLTLTFPLFDLAQSQVQGSVVLAGNNLRITPDSPLLGSAVGRVDFSRKGFTVVGASAKLFGGEASFEGGTQADASLRFTGQGTITADGLRRASELGAVAQAAISLSGQAAYRLNLGFVEGRPEFLLTSNLVGLSIDVPEPLRKAAATPLALRVQTALAPDSLGAGKPSRDTLRVELGSLVQAQYQRDLTGDAPKVLRGTIGVGEAAPAASSGTGVAAAISLPSVSLDAWQAWSEKLSRADAGREVQGFAGGGYAPDSYALRIGEFDAAGRRLNRLNATLVRKDGGWNAKLDAEQLAGTVEYRPARDAQQPGRVQARLARLALPRTDSDPIDSLLEDTPVSLPSLDIVVDEFELRGKALGKLEIEATNRVVGTNQREWQLAKLNLIARDSQLSATGTWSAAGSRNAPQRRRVALDFKLAIADSGSLLDRLGTAKAIRGGKGQLSGQIEWFGSPLALDYASLSGQVNVGIDAGQFLKADPGAARLLGVLSLQSLPRRLALDFRDVFQEGFAFDNITGDVKIERGTASTNNLRMRGVQAVVLMEGSADIQHETQALRVIVVPEINAGTASLAYAVINPALGLGSFLAQLFLRKPLTQAGTREFRISGSWSDPQVERVQRKLGDPVPELSAAPAAPPVR